MDDATHKAPPPGLVLRPLPTPRRTGAATCAGARGSGAPRAAGCRCSGRARSGRPLVRRRPSDPLLIIVALCAPEEL